MLNPPPGDDLYFVADGKGKSLFAATIAEHAKNVIAFRAAEHLKAEPSVQVPLDVIRDAVPSLPVRKKHQ